VKLHVFVFPTGLELEEFQLVDGSADPHQMAFTLQLERTNFAGNSWGFPFGIMVYSWESSPLAADSYVSLLEGRCTYFFKKKREFIHGN